MANSKSGKARLGFFVIFGGLLLIGAITVFGSGAMFRKSVSTYTEFRETVQGLEIGSPVKLRGVPIGRVDAITNGATTKAVVVHMEIDLESTRFTSNGELLNYLNYCVQQGLRCRLQYAGLTGMKYIELDYVRNAVPDLRTMEQRTTKEGLYMPSESSLIAGITDNLDATLRKIADIDIGGIVERLTTSLESLNQRLKDERIDSIMDQANETMKNANSVTAKVDAKMDELDVKALMAQVTALGSSLEESIKQLNERLDQADIPGTAKDVRQTLKEANDTLAEFRKVANSVAATVEQTVNEMKLPETTAKARDAIDSAGGTMAQADETLKAVQNMTRLANDLEATSTQLRETLRRIDELTETLSEDPGSLLHGKRIPNATPQ